MKRFILLALLAVVACSGGNYLQKQAIRYTKATYRDVDEIIRCSVDTVTLGDNLDFRIEQARRLGPEGRVEALDSLKGTIDPAVLAKPTAYNCCVQYNRVGNFVWVQLDEYGGLLTISKDQKDWLLNPGEDVPGYLDLILE